MALFKKTITFFSLLALSSLFGSTSDGEPSLRMVQVIEATESSIPALEKQIIELYHDEEGNPIPVVFRGAAKHWEIASWTPEYFAENFGEQEIEVLPHNLLEAEMEANNNLNRERREYGTCNEEGVFSDDDFELDALASTIINTTIKDHINNILLNPKNAGLFLCPLQLNSAESEEDNILTKNSKFAHDYLNFKTQILFPELIREEFDGYALIIGSENSVVSLHSSASTFLSQLYGKKIVRLVHPKYIEKCSCAIEDTDTSCKTEDEHKHTSCETLDRHASYCNIDIAAPDFDKYPELKDIEVHEIILESGDILYIPDHWLRDLRGLSPEISIVTES